MPGEAQGVAAIIIDTGEAHGVTAAELRTILDGRDAALLSSIDAKLDAIRDELSREVDSRMTALAAAVDQRATLAQVDARIDTSMQPLARKLETMQEGICAFMRRLEQSMERNETYTRAQGEINARVNGILDALTGQHNAQIEALEKRDERRDVELTELRGNVETLRLAHATTAGQTALLWQDVRGAEGDGQPSLFQMIREMEARTNVRLDNMVISLKSISETVAEDHKITDVLRTVFSWKAVSSGVKLATKTISSLPLAVRLAGLLTATALATQAVAPDAIPEIAKSIEALLK